MDKYPELRLEVTFHTWFALSAWILWDFFMQKLQLVRHSEPMCKYNIFQWRGKKISLSYLHFSFSSCLPSLIQKINVKLIDLILPQGVVLCNASSHNIRSLRDWFPRTWKLEGAAGPLLIPAACKANGQVLCDCF